MRKIFPLFIIFLVSVVGAVLAVEYSTHSQKVTQPEVSARESRVSVNAPKKIKNESVQAPHAKVSQNALPATGARVVLVSVDGFRTDLVQYMPEFRAMLKRGAWTLRAQTTVPSITTTAHASMFTGQPPEIHGVKSGAPRGSAIKTWHPLKVETIFHRLDASFYKPTAFVQKEKLLRLLPESLLVRKVLDRATRESVIVKGVCNEVADPDGSRMLIVHLKRFDAVGHDYGWMSDVQISAARHIDQALMRISECVTRAQNSSNHAFALIVTADHGGSGFNHDTRKESDMSIPWLVIGPGVKKNHEIRRAIQIMDTAAVIRYFLGHVDTMNDGIRARFPEEILKH